ncbi:GIY-YIG nuclease family protein [Bradyrhizobium sp. NBAIM14]|uniref:GIY-YIG nuclease family protein n=1 Tax=Bradyrhizobium sp. NBAIM14 TaxID=2793814 RepID=UPI001CD63FBA|nr:GIY-YIG nuclease family protein [Bradyrhizobium sp. NBAIM14]MCA1498854.1 GIY-YIG nuclease family protein [Bradyrhizobium sp. NBAIM14]
MQDILTEIELRFLRSQNLGPEDVMDVRGMPQWLWFQRIKEEGKTIALGSECRKVGHRLRSTKGHCVQCDTKKLAFAGRFNLKQYLYIAGSLQARLIKIGVCKDLGQRIRQICSERHGDARDWEILYAVEIERAGELEDRVLARLAAYSIYSTYWKDGVLQQSIELRRCSIKQAMEAITAVIEGKEFYLAINRRDKSAYEFT